MRLTLEIPETIGAELEAESVRTGLKVKDLAMYRIAHFGHFLSVEMLPASLNPNTIQSEGSVSVVESSSDSLRERIQMADLLLADGDKRLAKSNFQKRRYRQVALLKEAWQVLFPDDTAVLDANLKKWLVLCGDMAEDVFDALELVSSKNITGPGLVAYVAKVVADRPKPAREGRQSDSPYGNYTTPESWKIRPYNAAELKELEETKQHAIEMGWWKPEDNEP